MTTGRTQQRKLSRYRVRRWTTLAPVANAGARAARIDSMSRAAGLVERRLMEVCPHYQPRVTVGRVTGEPQLLFEMVVPAVDEADALGLADRRVERALRVRVVRAYGRERDMTLNLPMGKVEVTELG